MIGEKILKKQIEMFLIQYCDPYEGEDGKEYIEFTQLTDNIFKISQQAKGIRMKTSHIKEAILKYVDIKRDEETDKAYLLKEDVVNFLIEEMNNKYKLRKSFKKKEMSKEELNLLEEMKKKYKARKR